MRLTPQQVETALKASRAGAEPLDDSIDEWLLEVSYSSFADRLRFPEGR